MLTRIQVSDVELRHRFVHIILSGKTDRLPLPPLQVRAEVQIVALDVVRPAFAYPMLGCRQQLAI